MDSHIRVIKIEVNGEKFWKLQDLPYVILKSNSKEELQEKIMKILPSYFKEFPAEQARVLEIPKMERIPLEI